VLSKWKRAVVHLECATDSEHYLDRIRRVDERRAQLDRGEISHDDFLAELTAHSRDVRFHGTALFVRHSGRRYLLTARHVVWDELSARREFEEEVERASSWPEQSRARMLESAVERAKDMVFSIIFRVPSIDEMLAGRSPDRPAEFLMNLDAGTPDTAPYTFSSLELDLAVISLDQRDARFADELQAVGFAPISLDDLADGPDAEGSDVFTVGFPSSTAIIDQVSLHPAVANWASSHFSVPVTSFGKVSMLHNALPFFWVDMSIFPGNSGGPVVEGERLVGVVSQQATVPLDDVPEVRARIPFGRIIRAEYVRDLLRIQEQKDSR
jgi:hypothetical protein